MKIAIGSDHGGFKTKQELVKTLKKSGHQVLDLGCPTEESCDYPDIGEKVARAVSKGKVKKGILVCGTGIGMSIAANKVPKVRAAVSWSVPSAKLASEHNNANVLCLSGRFIPITLSKKMVRAWIQTAFGGGRHLRRIKKITAIERRSK